MQAVRSFLFVFLFFLSALWGEKVRFGSVELQTSYSDKLKEKEAVGDSLLPAFDGKAALQELLRRVPDLWALEGLADSTELLTALHLDLQFIDGTREDQFCELLSLADTSEQALAALDPEKSVWRLRMGLDFISGASNTLHDHVRICLQQAREQLAVVVRRGDVVELIPPQVVKEQIEEYRVNADLDGWLGSRVLKVSREVLRTAQCPRDIDDYLLLLQIWEQVSGFQIDLYQISQELDNRYNSGNQIQSCAYSREHNRRYSEDWSLQCDFEDKRCRLKQSSDGTTTWRYDDETDRFYFRGWRLFGIGWGRQGVRDGGKVLDLKLIPLSANLYLEAYLDADGTPLALGLLTIIP